MDPTFLFNSVPIGTTLTPVFAENGLTPGLYRLQIELFAVPVGTPVTSLTASFSGQFESVHFNVMRVLSTGATTVTNHNTMGTTAGNAWVYAEVLGYLKISEAGNLLIGATRSGGTSHTIQPASYIQIGL